jgi:hypothetical protein
VRISTESNASIDLVLPAYMATPGSPVVTMTRTASLAIYSQRIQRWPRRRLSVAVLSNLLEKLSDDLYDRRTAGEPTKLTICNCAIIAMWILIMTCDARRSMPV